MQSRRAAAGQVDDGNEWFLAAGREKEESNLTLIWISLATLLYTKLLQRRTLPAETRRQRDEVGD